MVKQILDDFEVLLLQLKETLLVAQAAKDETTADMLITTIASFEKHVWMLSFTLK